MLYQRGQVSQKKSETGITKVIIFIIIIIIIISSVKFALYLLGHNICDCSKSE